MATKEGRKLIFDALRYSPYPYQEEAHYWDLYNDSRVKLVTGGERSGKSAWDGHELAVRMMEKIDETGGKEKLLYWIVAKTYQLANFDYDYVAQDCIKLGLCGKNDISTTDIGPRTIKIKTGGLDIKIPTRSLQDVLSIASEPPDGILVAEAAQAPYNAVPRLMARTAEKRAWLVLSGTHEGAMGWFWKMAQKYRGINTDLGKSFIFHTWENKKLFPGGRNDPEILWQEQTLGHEKFMERFSGEASAPAGLRFRNFNMLVHTGDYPYEPGKPVYLWIDPGYAGFYVVLVVQLQDDTVFVVDEVFLQGHDTYTVIDHCSTQPWWKDKAGGVVDIAAKQHQAMPAVWEVWAQKGLYLSTLKVDINEGDDRIQSFLNVDAITGKPHLFINSTCEGIISEFGGCLNPTTGMGQAYKWKTGPDGQIIGNSPNPINNHAISALRYGLVNTFGYINQTIGVKSGSYLEWGGNYERSRTHRLSYR